MNRVTWHVLTYIVLTLLAFSGLYVYATMNAIGDYYQLGIESFKRPFGFIYLSVLLLSLSSLIVCVLSQTVKKFLSKYLVSYGAGLVIVAIVVLLLGRAPCLKSPKTIDSYGNPRALELVIEKSILCPQYSNRSYGGILYYVILGLTMVSVGKNGRKKNA